jgi:diadenosine tetraphosphate (Ap4A) HIT family hydrolase
MTDCPICAKHVGTGPLAGAEVWRDDLVVVGHALPERAYLGNLYVETRRHAPYLDDLTDAEATAVGLTVRTAAAALRASLDLEHVFSAVVGRAIPHFHQHLIPRYRGTPDSLPWHASDEWEGAPHGGWDEVRAMIERLRPYFA